MESSSAMASLPHPQASGAQRRVVLITPGLCLDVFSVQSLERKILNIFSSVSSPLSKKIQNFRAKFRQNVSFSFTAITKTPVTMKCKKNSLFPLRAGFSLAQMLAKPSKFRGFQRRIDWAYSETWKRVSIIRLLIFIAKKRMHSCTTHVAKLVLWY